jgi:hypothetical protein
MLPAAANLAESRSVALQYVSFDFLFYICSFKYGYLPRYLLRLSELVQTTQPRAIMKETQP